MRSTPDVKQVAARTSSRKTIAVSSCTGAHRAVTVAPREFGKVRRGSAKGVILASSANPYGA